MPSVAVVTGASSGIGAATARKLAEAATAWSWPRAVPTGSRTSPRDRGIGGQADPVALDVTDRPAVDAFAAGLDRCDVLVNNAGGAFGGDTVAAADPADWQAMFEVNVLGALHVTQALLPRLIASGDGTIVVISSTAGLVAYEGGGGYVAAKHGAHVIAETLRLELYDQPVRVIEIAPGMVRTDEFALNRFRGDAGTRGRGLRRRRRAADRRGRRRHRRLGRHPPLPRERGPAGPAPPGPGRPAQGLPPALAANSPVRVIVVGCAPPAGHNPPR